MKYLTVNWNNVIVCTYSCVFAHFVSEIFQKVLIERRTNLSTIGCKLVLGFVTEAYWCGCEAAPICGEIAELIFKAPGNTQ